MPIDFDQWISFLKKHWPTWPGLLSVSILLATTIDKPIISQKWTWEIKLTVIIACHIAIIIAWAISRRVPRTKDGKFGFAISINCENEAEANQVRKDFIESLQRLVLSGKAGPSFQFIQFPNHVSERITDITSAIKYKSTSNVQILLYGQVRVRGIHGKECHYLELNGVVGHKPISVEVSKTLSREFTELLPREVAIPKENDLLEFKVTSEKIDVVTRYIVGIAMLLSGNFDYADKLYDDVRDRINAEDRVDAIYRKVRKRLVMRKYEVLEARAQLAYFEWRKNHDADSIRKLADAVGRINSGIFKSLAIIQLRAISQFLLDRNTTRATATIRKIPKRNREATWYFNLAFLAAYDGNLGLALGYYKTADNFDPPTDVLVQVEEFIFEIVTLEPSKYQLYFCLGYFNKIFKQDKIMARKDLQSFLDSGQSGEYQKERALALKWIAELS